MGYSFIAAIGVAIASCFTTHDNPVQPTYHVAIVDRFYPGDDYYRDDEDRLLHTNLHGLVDLDRDRLREPFYHGEIVSILASHPAIEIHRYEMQPGAHPQQEILRQLKNVRKHLFWGEPISAVVLSWESSTLVSAFEKPLRRENVSEYKESVRQWGSENPIWQLSYDTIRLLEDIAEMGVKVYTIAGNGGKGMVNTYSFADGITTVGAREAELKNFVSDNVFVDVHMAAAYQPQLVRDVSGTPRGYDFDGDSCVDVPISCLSGYRSDRMDYPEKTWPLLKGSSFAAPVAMRVALLNDAFSWGAGQQQLGATHQCSVAGDRL